MTVTKKKKNKMNLENIGLKLDEIHLQFFYSSNLINRVSVNNYITL